jgi:hypothetical protein
MRLIALLAIVSLAACDKSPIEWGAIVQSNVPLTPNEFPSALASSPSPAACPVSLRIATTGGDQYAVWWEARPDSSVILMTARSENRKPWSKPVAADTTDHGVRGCGRPPPAVAADSASGYVHIAYFSEPKDGPGIFFAHSMDKAATFHSPVPIVFGRSPSRVSVASSGDRVAVAYEDPNASQPLVGVALSRSMGHIFESRTIASSENGRARQPVVRLKGDSIQLWWSEYSPNPIVSATRPYYRAGHWK